MDTLCLCAQQLKRSNKVPAATRYSVGVKQFIIAQHTTLQKCEVSRVEAGLLWTMFIIITSHKSQN